MFSSVAPLHVVVIPLVVFAAGFLQSLSGFGFSLIAMPVLTLFLPARSVAPVLVVLCLFLNAAVVFKARKHLDLKSIWPLLLTGVLFTPVGTQLLKVADDETMRIAISSVVVFVSLYLISGRAIRTSGSGKWMAGTGVLSGIMNGAATFAGPPVIVFLLGKGEAKHSFRATLTGYFLLLGLFTFANYSFAGLMFTQETGVYSALAILPMGLGVGAGIKLADKVSERAFKRLVTWLVLAVGVVSLGVTLGERLLS